MTKDLKFHKNHIVKSFLKLLEIPGLEIRIINNQIFGTYWKSNIKRLNSFHYIIPEGLNVNFVLNKRNKISGIELNYTRSNVTEVLTEIKHLHNLIIGVLKPYEKSIEIYGTGFRFNFVSDELSQEPIIEINAGFNENKQLKVPKNIIINKLDTNRIDICSNDKHTLAEFASSIKRIKPLNRYKLRGIKLSEEIFVPKAYKKSK